MATLRLNVDSGGLKSGVDAFKQATSQMKAAAALFGAGLYEAQSRLTGLGESARALDLKRANEGLKNVASGAAAASSTLDAARRAALGVAPTFKTLEQFAAGSAKSLSTLGASGASLSNLAHAIEGTGAAATSQTAPIKGYSEVVSELGKFAKIAGVSIGEMSATLEDNTQKRIEIFAKAIGEAQAKLEKLPYTGAQVQEAFGRMGKATEDINQATLRTVTYLMRADEGFNRVIPTAKELFFALAKFQKNQEWIQQLTLAEGVLAALETTVDRSAFRLWKLADAQDATSVSLKKLATTHATAVADVEKLVAAEKKEEATAQQVRDAYKRQQDALVALNSAKRVAAQNAKPFGTGVSAGETSGDFGAGVLTAQDRLKAGLSTLVSTSTAMERMTEQLRKQEEQLRLATIAEENYIAAVERRKFQEYGDVTAKAAVSKEVAKLNAEYVRSSQELLKLLDSDKKEEEAAKLVTEAVKKQREAYEALARAKRDASQPKAAFGAGVTSPAPAREYVSRGQSQPFGAGVDLEKPAKRTWDLNQALVSVNKRTKELAENSGGLAKGLHEIQLFGGSARSVVSQLFLGFSAIFAIREGITSTARALSDFDTAMHTVSAVTHITGAELEKAEKEVRKFGATSTYGAGKTAEAYTALVKAGLDAAEATAALPQTLNFATVAQISLSEAAETTSKTLRQFNISASDSERAMDSLTVVANSTVTSVLPLAEAMKNVGPIAADLGNSIEVVSASLGVLAERGVQGGSAGTKLRGIMLALTSPTREAQIAIEELRDSVTGSRLSMEQLDPRVHSISEIFKVLGRSNFDAATAAKLFNDRFASAGLVLARGSDRIEELVAKQKELRGETERNATTINESLGKAFDKLNAAVEELVLSMGDDGLKGTLKSILGFATDVVLALAEFEDPAKKIGIAARLTATAVETLVAAVAGLAAVRVAAWLVTVQGGLISLTATVQAAREAWILYAAAQTTANAAAATSAIGATIVIASAAVYGLVSALGDLSKATDASNESYTRHLTTIEKAYAAELKLQNSQKIGNLSKQREAYKDYVNSIEETVRKEEEARAKQKAAFDKWLEDTSKPMPSLQFAGLTYKDIEPLIKGAEKTSEALKQAKIDAVTYANAAKQALRDGVADVSQYTSVKPKTPIELLSDAADELKSKIGQVNREIGRASGVREEGEAFAEAATSLEKFVAKLELRARIARETRGLSERDARDLAELIELEDSLRSKAAGKEKDDVDALIVKYRSKIKLAQQDLNYTEDANKAIKDRKDALEVFEREVRELRVRADLSKEGVDERKRELEVERLTVGLRKVGIDLTQQERAEIRGLVDQILDGEKAQRLVVKTERERESSLKKMFNSLQLVIRQQQQAEASAQSFVARYRALAGTIDDTVEAQAKAAVLARYDAIFKDKQTEAVKKLRVELEGYLNQIESGDNRAVVRQVEDLVARYELQARSLEISSDQHKEETANLELESITRGKAVAGLNLYQKRLADAFKLIREGSEKGRDKRAQDIVRGMENELELLKLSNEERDKKVRLQQLEAIESEGYVKDVEEKRRRILELGDQIKFQAKMKELAGDISNSFVSSIEDAVFSVKSLSDAFKDLGRDILAAMFRSQVSQPIGQFLQGGLQGFFGSLFGGGGGGVYGPPPPPGSGHYAGNAFSTGGNVTRMAMGGVVDNYAEFSGRNGARYSIAERAPEAVMPLHRTSGGEMGVKVTGGGGSVTNVKMSVYAQDANSFRRSSNQIIRDFKRKTR
ncbi:minor tail protein [Caudoviricetes sp.]|nr:minor tail protein [Caudoviricetes sp.]UOF82742.1 minor tail protein [Caudoviricetes sp.]